MYYNYKEIDLRIRRRFRLILSAVLFVPLAFALSFWSSTKAVPVDSLDLTSTVLQVAEVTYEEKEWIPELPVRLIIPAIGVDANVQHVGLDTSDGAMDTPSNFTDVGWYKHGIRPGMRGSAVITGHFNGKETPEAVFYDLHTLRPHDEIVVMSEERIEDIFYVVRVETYDYDAETTDVFMSSDGKARLNLITCSGEWLPEEMVYDKRTVVFAELLTDVE